MAKQKMQKFTIKDFQKKFPNDDTCLEYLRNRFWPEVFDCPNCGKEAKYYRIRTKKVYGCEWCGHQISPSAGTIFHKSSTPLTIWFYVIYSMAQTRGGVSAKQIERETGVTYKTAWRMCKQVRKVLFEDLPPFDGDVEIDDSYFGGRRRGVRGRGAKGKTVVFGMAQRGGAVGVRKVKNLKAKTILPLVDENISRAATVHSDEFRTYKALPAMGYRHGTVEHAKKIYVAGNVHTNTIEGFWSLCKNGIRGVFHAVSSKYLQYYLNEYAFRYNNRDKVRPMFYLFLDRVIASKILSPNTAQPEK